MAEFMDDDHRTDSEWLAEFAAKRGLSLSTERAFRAWSNHSEDRFAGWITLANAQEDNLFAALQAEVAKLVEEDRALAEDDPLGVAGIVFAAGREGIEMTRPEAIAAWADLSACKGQEWMEVEGSNLEAFFETRRPETAPAPRP